jgi:RND family efflux transporter MFP subunit
MPQFRVDSFLLTGACAALLALPACHDHGHDHAAPHADGHADEHADEHGHATEVAIARLGERYLVHLIVPPLARGERAEFLLHGTRLDVGTAISGGEVTVVFSGPGGERVEAAARERIPGHWPLEATLGAAGTWSVAARVRSTNGDEEVALGAVVVHPDADTAAHAETPAPPAGAIPFLFESQWPVAMEFERVTPQPFVERVVVSGRIEARPGARAHASTPAAGRVLPPAGGSLPRPGERVEAGQVLARVQALVDMSHLVGLQSLEYQQHQLRHELDVQELAADRALGQARVAIAAGTRAVERAQRLLESTLGTQADLDAASAALEMARAEERAALSSIDSVQRLRNEHAEDPRVDAPTYDVVAPIAGVIARFDAIAGETVEAGATLATVVDLRRAWAVADVPEDQLARVARAAGAHIVPSGAEAVIPAGAPVYVAPEVEAVSRTAAVAFEIANDDGRLAAGTLATIEIAAAARTGVLSVPLAAVHHEQGRPVVYALHDGETFVKRRLRLGARDGARVEVLAGLAAGDVIAATEVEELRLAALAGSGQIQDHHH